MIRKFILTSRKLLKQTIVELSANDPLRMAGATAFFTSFALPPILMIIVRTLGLFMDRRELGRQLAEQLNKLFGRESTGGILQTIRSFSALQHNYLITAGIFLFLLFVATTLFKIIKNSVNQIWNIRKRHGGTFTEGLISRAVSVAVILLGGVLFMVVQLIDTGQHMLGGYFINGFPKTVFYVHAGLYQVIIVAVSTVWFYFLFLFLPDGKPYWKVALLGAFVTGLLFNAGKWALQILLRPGQVNSFYGASGAIVLVLLFVFYSSIILYFGAAFIKALGDDRKKPLRLKPHTFKYRLEEVAVE